MNKNKKNKKAKTNAEEKQVVSTSSVISEKLQGDIDELKNSYDSFLYVSKPFSSTNINNLQAKAKMYGLNPVPLKGARVLELGASCGGNIVPQALYYPEATFTGIDLSGVQVKHGNDIINSIGLAYVSYNTYPGWKRLEQLRDIMLYSEKRAKDQDLLERTLYTKNVLKMVADTMNIDDRSRAQSAYKINNIHNVLNSNDYYVAHEYLEAFNDPVYVSDFIERARKQGCAYIGDEVLQRSFITWLADDVTNNIRTLSHDNYVDKEQFYDYVYDTQFRMSLLTKLSNEDKINHEETVTQDILNSLYYVGNSRNEKGVPEDWTDTVNIAIKELMDTHKQFNVQGIINHINSQYPGYNINMDQLYQRLLLLTIVGQINIFGESYPMTPFVENESYIPQRFINYVNTLIMKDGNKYMALGNMYNQLDNEVDNGVLYVMNQLAQPTSRAKLLELVDADLTVNRTTKDGYTYKVPSEQYLNEVLVHLEYLGYFTK